MIPPSLWVVVKVESGIPVLAEVYRCKRTAERRERLLRGQMNPENDEVSVFECRVNDGYGHAPAYHTASSSSTTSNG